MTDMSYQFSVMKLINFHPWSLNEKEFIVFHVLCYLMQFLYKVIEVSSSVGLVCTA